MQWDSGRFRVEDRVIGDVLLQDIPRVGKAGDVWSVANPAAEPALRRGEGWWDPVTVQRRADREYRFGDTPWPQTARWTPGRMITDDELSAALGSDEARLGEIIVDGRGVRSGDVIRVDGGRELMAIRLHQVRPGAAVEADVVDASGDRSSLWLPEQVRLMGRRWTALTISEQQAAARQRPWPRPDWADVEPGRWAHGAQAIIRDSRGSVTGRIMGPHVEAGTGVEGVEIRDAAGQSWFFSHGSVQDFAVIEDAATTGLGRVDLRSLALDPSALGEDPPTSSSAVSPQIPTVHMIVMSDPDLRIEAHGVPVDSAAEDALRENRFVPALDHEGRWVLDDVEASANRVRYASAAIEAMARTRDLGVEVVGLGPESRFVPAGLVQPGQDVRMDAGTFAAMNDPAAGLTDLVGRVRRTGPGFVEVGVGPAEGDEPSRLVAAWVSETTLVEVTGDVPAVDWRPRQISGVAALEDLAAGQWRTDFPVREVAGMNTIPGRRDLVASQLRVGDQYRLKGDDGPGASVIGVHSDAVMTRVVALRDQAEGPARVTIEVMDSMAVVDVEEATERPDGALSGLQPMLGSQVRTGDWVTGVSGTPAVVVSVGQGYRIILTMKDSRIKRL